MYFKIYNALVMEVRIVLLGSASIINVVLYFWQNINYIKMISIKSLFNTY